MHRITYGCFYLTHWPGLVQIISHNLCSRKKKMHVSHISNTHRDLCATTVFSVLVTHKEEQVCHQSFNIHTGGLCNRFRCSKWAPTEEARQTTIHLRIYSHWKQRLNMGVPNPYPQPLVCCCQASITFLIHSNLPNYKVSLECSWAHTNNVSSSPGFVKTAAGADLKSLEEIHWANVLFFTLTWICN